jgi:hypothetical protein
MTKTRRLTQMNITEEEFDALPIDTRLKSMYKRLFHADTTPEQRAMIIAESGRYSG